MSISNIQRNLDPIHYTRPRIWKEMKKLRPIYNLAMSQSDSRDHGSANDKTHG